MSPFVISIMAFVGVTALVGAVMLMLRGKGDPKIEDRLTVLAGAKPAGGKLANASVLTTPLDSGGFAEAFMERFHNLSMLFEQADTTLTPSKFFIISVCMGIAGALASLLAGVHPGAMPVMGLLTGALPLMWLIFRRRRRLKMFAKQLPDALELIARALRSGHSLASGFNLVSEEMNPPLSVEFNRTYEEQNLGIPLDDALRGLTERVPNLDLKFFATAVVLQRQTGGDLAEILDKIGNLVRERFKIWGQVQALTGEGRLSGVVLLGLPPALFAVMYYLNPDYVMMLFTDPMGKQMLAGAIVMQILGALVIRKIVNIKV